MFMVKNIPLEQAKENYLEKMEQIDTDPDMV